MIWIILYCIGALLMLRSAIRFAAKEDEYDWDMNEPADIFLLGFVSFVSAIFWPVTILLSIFATLVKKTYQKNLEGN